MITRKQYLADGANLHQAYYLQFATNATFEIVKRHIGVKAILASTDPHFNDIRLSNWDGIEPLIKRSIDTKLKREAETEATQGGIREGSFLWSQSDGVCIAKAVARDIKATHEAAQAKFAKKA